MTSIRTAPTFTPVMPAYARDAATNIESLAAHGSAASAHGSAASSSSLGGDEIFHTEIHDGSAASGEPHGASAVHAPTLYGRSQHAGEFKRQESFRDLTRRARAINRELQYGNIALADHRDATLGLTTSPAGSDFEPLTDNEAREILSYQSKLTEQNVIVQRLLKDKQGFGSKSSLLKARLDRLAAWHMLERNSKKLGLSKSMTERLSRHPDVVAHVHLQERLPSQSELVDLHESPEISLSVKTRTQSDAEDTHVRGGSETSGTSFPSFHYSAPETRHKGFPGD